MTQEIKFKMSGGNFGIYGKNREWSRFVHYPTKSKRSKSSRLTNHLRSALEEDSIIIERCFGDCQNESEGILSYTGFLMIDSSGRYNFISPESGISFIIPKKSVRNFSSYNGIVRISLDENERQRRVIN